MPPSATRIICQGGTFLALCGLLAGCGAYPRSSLRPGNYSTTSGRPLESAYAVPEPARPPGDSTSTISVESRAIVNPAPFPDYKVVRFVAGRVLCRDTFQPAARTQLGGWGKEVPQPPGIVVTESGLGIDEAEITNLDWHQFELAQREFGTASVRNAPSPAALPVSDYYGSPFYAYYPVVGISYEQAQRFCQWRAQVVNEELAHSGQPGVAGFECEFRLPTEAEWEEAAAVRSGQPYGTACPQLRVRVAPAAAAYLRKRANLATADLAKIKADIAAYNRQQPLRPWINCAQPEPYFLQLATPGYVYQGPANYFGLYQMLGNAAELVQERGITKGGSYRDALADCRIKARGRYDGPAPHIGFRAVCTVRRRP